MNNDLLCTVVKPLEKKWLILSIEKCAMDEIHDIKMTERKLEQWVRLLSLSSTS